jgi:DNA processing protein
MHDDPTTLEPAEEALLRLSLVDGIGPRLSQALLERFVTAEAVFAASDEQLREVEGIGPKLCTALRRAQKEVDVAAEYANVRQHGARLLFRGTAAYPPMLAAIPDPPLVLYVQGTILPQDAVAVAIVGSRHATHYGTTQAERLASGLARAGITVVSGLARGIDGAAHRGALNAGGRTIAVLGSGLAKLYPPEHRELAAEIVGHGAVVSESPILTDPVAGAFPQRNRIISGLSCGTVVVEASDRSGALITVVHSIEQGREVFAVPGPVDSRMSRGCHHLLRDGARLVETVDDILNELGPLSVSIPSADPDGPSIHKPAELLLNDHEKLVLAVVGEGRATTVDDVIAASGLSTPQVLTIISVLEMRRLIRRVDGNAVHRI